MEEQELRNIVVATGPELLCEGLVARTWGPRADMRSALAIFHYIL